MRAWYENGQLREKFKDGKRCYRVVREFIDELQMGW